MPAQLIDAIERHKAAFDAGADVQESFVSILKRVATRLAATAPAPGPAVPQTPIAAAPSSPVALVRNPSHDADPTLVDDAPARDLLHSMGLLDTSSSAFDYAGAYEAWTMDVGGEGTYLGEGEFAPHPVRRRVCSVDGASH
jgi:hypothetical protein